MENLNISNLTSKSTTNTTMSCSTNTAHQTNTDDPILSFNLTTEKSHYPCNEEISTFLNMQVKAGKSAVNESKRTPLDIMIVLDKSGSMYGDKLNLCKATIEFLVSQLTDEDYMGITLFDSNVQSYDMMRMDRHGKKEIENILDNTHDGSATNLSGGLFKGMEVLLNRPEGEEKRLKTLFLLTDGQANKGLTDSGAIVSSLLDQHLSKNRNIIINTFGYGADHDLQLLQQISEVGHGSYYFIESNENVADCFADCLGGLLAVVAEDIHINFTTSTDMIIKPMIGQNAVEFEAIDEGKSYNIKLKNIGSDEIKDIMFELTLPNLGISNSMIEWNAGKLSYQYQDLRNDTNSVEVHMEEDLIIPRITAEELASINVIESSDVIYNRLRIHAVDTLSKARLLAQRDDTGGARAILQPIRDQIKEELSKIDANYRDKLNSLLKDVNDSMSAMRSREEFERVGRFFVQSTINENTYQKSCKMDSAYASPMQMNLRSAARGAVSSSKYMTPHPPSSKYMTPRPPLRFQSNNPQDSIPAIQPLTTSNKSYKKNQFRVKDCVYGASCIHLANGNCSYRHTKEDQQKEGPWFLAHLNAAMLQRNNGTPLNVCQFKECLMRQAEDFDPRTYGYKRFVDFLENYVLNLSDEYELSTNDAKNVFHIVPKKK